MRCCSPNPFFMAQVGRIADDGNERPQRISRLNRSAQNMPYGIAVTFAPGDGVVPPSTLLDPILGFTVLLTETDVTAA